MIKLPPSIQDPESYDRYVRERREQIFFRGALAFVVLFIVATLARCVTG